MENLIIEETKYTPAINLNSDSGILEITGRSYPENSFEFYKPVLDWLDEYFENASKDKTIINMEIIYFNSSSSKVFFDLFDLLEEQHGSGKDIQINWIHDEEDEGTIEAGEDFKEDFEDLDFNLVQK